MRRNTTKAKLKAGEPVFGCFVRYPSASLVELLTFQGWDFLVLDGEHGTLTPEDCENMVRSAELHNVTPLARVTTNQPSIILRYLDTGAQGVHVPWVSSGAEAEAAVGSIKYYPRGTRGLAGVRAADYAQTIPFADYVPQANAETLVVIQVETAAAVERLPEIVAVDGVDVVFIGPTDLSHSLGLPGDTQHPRVQAAIDQIVKVVSQTNIALGIMVPNTQAAKQWRERGARYIATGLESVLRQGTRDFLQGARC